MPAPTTQVYRALDKAGLVIHHGIAEMSTATATGEQARRLRIQRKAPPLRISQADYHSDGDAIVFPDEYHVADAFKDTVYLKAAGEATNDL
jgi:DNA-binding GntR family transcriptional regulator